MGKIIKRAIEKDKLLNELETNIKSGGRLVCINGYINEEGQMMVIYTIEHDEVEKYKEYIKKSQDKIIITYVGRMIEEKGVLKLIEAFKKLEKKYSNLELNLAGAGPILEKIETENKEEKNIHILGKVSHDEVLKLLGKTTIFVNPSAFSEGLPTSILEAGIMNCAVVATPMGGTTEIISSDDIGYICGFETDEILEKIEKLINNKEKIEKLSMNINQKVKEQFSWDITAKKIAETIKYKKQ